jgi:hypothetical protein
MMADSLALHIGGGRPDLEREVLGQSVAECP